MRTTLTADFSTLYNGTNSNGQKVFSWVSNTNLTSLNEDISPLIYFLPHHGLVPFDTYLGTIDFGSETFFASQEVNFTVSHFSASLQTPSNTSNGSTPVSTQVTQLPSPSSGADSGSAALLTRGASLYSGCALLLTLTSLVLPGVGSLLF